MKFDQLIENSKMNIFLQNHTENETERLAPDLFCFLKRFASGLQLSLNIF